jgi:aspartyl-tRNA(Asn)/glutamyl-tRNA(Gln) amidotransferase subunit A
MIGRFREWSAQAPDQNETWSDLLTRARKLNPILNAFHEYCSPAASAPGALSGLPYAAKDIFAAPDRQPLGGLAQPLPRTTCRYADVLRLLDEAGAMRLGYTALTEIAYEPSGYNAVHGRVRNPWNLDFISGGSSSGSAAAVASGSVVVALGSDTGGSLRIPAHACGITAWKPTWGMVSTRGAMPLAPTLDTIGLLARSAADMMPAAHVLGDLRDETSVRSGVVLQDALEAAHPSVRKACQDGIDAIAACGVLLDRRDGLAAIDAADESFFTIMQGEAARCHRRPIDDDAIDPVLRRRLAKGLAIDDASLAAAVAQRSALAAAFVAEVLGTADIAILPVMTIRTPPAAECDPQDASFSPRILYSLSRLTRFVNMLGLPAVALPVGYDDRRLPVAMQIIGSPGADRALLALTTAVQTRSTWHGHVPDAIASLMPDDGAME